MPKFLLATANPGKIEEYRLLLGNLGYQITILAGLAIAKVVAETGSSYEQNARAKAVAYAEISQLITIADDSGLEVDALGGEPGVHSARFAGENATDEEKVRTLLARLNGVPWEKRTACFKCVIAIATPEGQLELCHGECRGIITFEARGKNGFGYDPIFYLPEMGRTMAELPLKIKNKISHRAQASLKAHRVLKLLHSQAH
ncbi:MAG TPA: RdgB/HAM1 family non-canonical purine NTP pyrophosphatase [Dehalococcoidia bacterium]|nr:RdgB/HAM1 family non-canonical purine NTP pyrophosphatase [Dehalococcoidia bacterium]